MEVNILSEDAFSVYITKDELIYRGLSPADVELEEARQLIEELMERPIRDSTLELYSAGGDLLVFVTRNCAEISLFVFTELESLIEAALACDSAASSLLYMDGRYYLSVRGKLSGAFAEYGTRVSSPELIAANIAEHGRLIVSDNAIQKIKETFAP